MRSSLFVSIAALCLVFSACAPSLRSGCGQSETVELTRADIPAVIIVADSLRTFDMDISFFEKHLNGMMLVKRQAPATIRILVNSYFGMSMADFELRTDTFVVHYLMEAMNKQSIVSLFRKDMELLFCQPLPERFTALQSVCRPHGRLLSIETPQGKYRYRIHGENGENRIIEEMKAPGVRIKILSSNFPRTVQLKHRGIFGPAMVIRELQ